MTLPTARFFDGVKYMWDGADYDTADDAEKAQAKYRSDGFETHSVEEDGKFQVYTRRVVSDVQVDGASPI